MTRGVKDGKVILFYEPNELMKHMTFKIGENKKKVFFFDTYGTIIGIDKETGKRTIYKPIYDKRKGYGEPRIKIGKTKYSVKGLITKRLFKGVKNYHILRVHRFDGNCSNNCITNFYLDITAEEVDTRIGKYDIH